MCVACVLCVLVCSVCASCVLQDGWSPLHAASSNGYVEVVEGLIEAGANVNQCDMVGTHSSVFIVKTFMQFNEYPHDSI